MTLLLKHFVGGANLTSRKPDGLAAVLNSREEMLSHDVGQQLTLTNLPDPVAGDIVVPPGRWLQTKPLALGANRLVLSGTTQIQGGGGLSAETEISSTNADSAIHVDGGNLILNGIRVNNSVGDGLTGLSVASIELNDTVMLATAAGKAAVELTLTNAVTLNRVTTLGGGYGVRLVSATGLVLRSNLSDFLGQANNVAGFRMDAGVTTKMCSLHQTKFTGGEAAVSLDTGATFTNPVRMTDVFQEGATIAIEAGSTPVGGNFVLLHNDGI